LRDIFQIGKMFTETLLVYFDNLIMKNQNNFDTPDFL
jgi:hypothetical protein